MKKTRGVIKVAEVTEAPCGLRKFLDRNAVFGLRKSFCGNEKSIVLP